MTKPLLQLALDHTSLPEALEAVKVLHPYIDIIESGTILCVSEGMKAVRELRALYPDHILVCDLKVADAGEMLATEAFNAGADWMTVICAAPLATMASAQKVAAARNCEIQIELFGYWTIEDAKEWVKLGITQAIYHRGRDAQASGQTWGQKDLDLMKQLSDVGIQLSVTGGITPEDLHLFRDISVKAFIAGRALAQAPNPAAAAKAFHQSINEIWGE